MLFLQIFKAPQKPFNILNITIASQVLVLIIRVKEIRALPDTALKSKLEELALELGIERRKVASTGVASKVVKTRNIKRTIAKIQTILNERGAKL